MESTNWPALVGAFKRSGPGAVHDAIVDEARRAIRDVDPSADRAPQLLELVVLDVPRVLARRYALDKLVASGDRDAFVDAVEQTAVDRWRWQELVDEFRSLRTIGPRISGEVERVVRRRVGLSADAEGVAQDVCAYLLENAGAQLQYAMMYAQTLSEFRGLVGSVHLRNVRSRAQVRTIYDNLRDRVADLLASPPYRLVGEIEGSDAYAAVGARRAVRKPERDELRIAYREAADVPRLRPNPASERASMVYTTPNLARVVAIVAEALSSAFRVEDVMEVIDLLLAGYYEIHGPERAGSDERRARDRRDPTADRATAHEAARAFLERLDGPRRRALALMLYELDYQVVADLVDVSRQSIDNWRGKLAEIGADAFESLSAEAERLALLEVVQELTFEGLLAACEGLLRTEGYNRAAAPSGETVYGRGVAAAPRLPSDGEIAAAAGRIASLHRGGEVELYSVDWCRRALNVLAEECGSGFTVDSMREALEQGTSPARMRNTDDAGRSSMEDDVVERIDAEWTTER